MPRARFGGSLAKMEGDPDGKGAEGGTRESVRRAESKGEDRMHPHSV